MCLRRIALGNALSTLPTVFHVIKEKLCQHFPFIQASPYIRNLKVVFLDLLSSDIRPKSERFVQCVCIGHFLWRFKKLMFWLQPCIAVYIAASTSLSRTPQWPEFLKLVQKLWYISAFYRVSHIVVCESKWLWRVEGLIIWLILLWMYVQQEFTWK